MRTAVDIARDTIRRQDVHIPEVFFTTPEENVLLLAKEVVRLTEFRFTAKHFEKINGYETWVFEDDDLWERSELCARIANDLWRTK